MATNTYKVRTMTVGGGFAKTYEVEATDGWSALDIAQPLAEADGYEVLDGVDRRGERGETEFTLVIAD